MKVLLFLFSLYMLVLTGIPCQGDDDCSTESPFTNTIQSSNSASKGVSTAAHKADRQPDAPRPCSPFFACGTCHGFLVPERYIPAVTNQPIIIYRSAFHEDASLPDFSYPIWQPPRTA